MQFKRPRKIAIQARIGTMVHRHFSSSNTCWHLSFQTTVAFFLPCIFTRNQPMQGLGYLRELGDEPVIISCEPKKTLDFGNSGGGGPIFDGIYLSLIECIIPWAETVYPRYVTCLQNSSHLEGLRFSLACSSFWKISLQPHRGGWPDPLRRMTISSK